MRLARYIKKESLTENPRVLAMLDRLQAGGCEVYTVKDSADVRENTDMLLSIGGDGTFLSAARFALPHDIPVLGVHFGRMGFLSECEPEAVADAILDGLWQIEERTLLRVSVDGAAEDRFVPYAVNEMSVSRVSASMLGVDVTVDGVQLPTYWADGLLVATSSGSTAYSLSVGGPICFPESRVFIVAPVSPHNLNVRPLIVPESAKLSITLRSRDEEADFAMDNKIYTIPADSVIRVEAAPVHLKRVCLGKSNFVDALRSRLLWGMDVRNGVESN